jgi:hypothetical protein
MSFHRRLAAVCAASLGFVLWAPLSGCSKSKESESSSTSEATGSAASDKKAAAKSVDACKDPNAVKVTPKGMPGGACVVMPATVKKGKESSEVQYGSTQFVSAATGAYVGHLSYKQSTEKPETVIDRLAGDSEMEVVSKGPLEGHGVRSQIVQLRKSTKVHSASVFLEHGSLSFTCHAADMEDAVAMCQSLSPLDPAPVIATDGNASAVATATPSAASEEASGGAADLEGDYGYYDSGGGSGSGRLKSTGKDFVISYSGSSGSGQVNCKSASDTEYKCTWADPSGSGGATFKRSADGNTLNGSWYGSGGGGWTFTRAKKK